MFLDNTDITEEKILQWLKRCVRDKTNIIGEGYHGSVYLYDENGFKLVVKASHAEGFLSKFLLSQLHKEYQAYQRLDGVDGIPKCYGLLEDKYLILEFVDGVSLRTAELSDRVSYFQQYLALIKVFHERGVAHGDMKRKENLLVVNGKDPCIIDFGIAIIKKQGFHPINHFLFNFARQMDYDAWAKHKYRGNYATITEEDKRYIKRTLIERVSKRLKQLIYPVIRAR